MNNSHPIVEALWAWVADQCLPLHGVSAQPRSLSLPERVARLQHLPRRPGSICNCLSEPLRDQALHLFQDAWNQRNLEILSELNAIARWDDRLACQFDMIVSPYAQFGRRMDAREPVA